MNARIRTILGQGVRVFPNWTLGLSRVQSDVHALIKAVLELEEEVEAMKAGEAEGISSSPSDSSPSVQTALNKVRADAIRDAVRVMLACRDATGWNLRDTDDPDSAHSPDRWLLIYADRLEDRVGQENYVVPRSEIDALHRRFTEVEEHGLTEGAQHFARIWGGKVRAVFSAAGWQPTE